MILTKMRELSVKLLYHFKGLRSQITTSSERNPDKCLEPPPATSSSSLPPLSSSDPSQPPFPPSSHKMEVGKRPMKYPYTLTAKFVQFPLRYYVSNVWLWKYYFVAVGLTLPLFYKIGKLSKSPENVAKWNEIRRKEFSGERQHH